eukprot:TRINITY_DN19476_c0_g1_i13.p1 TRINITY_DN19476_c0_g1~~TRINITY_DN19476_c0_g1_i13.p1  ORF type:complete len:471 (+),score=72.20 TRINITY_DN19476_c0_g1_i13:178-1590(+)
MCIRDRLVTCTLQHQTKTPKGPMVWVARGAAGLAAVTIAVLALVPTSGLISSSTFSGTCAQTHSVRDRLATKVDYHLNSSGLADGARLAADAGCTPIQLQVVGRHGARYPTTRDWTQKMEPLLAKIKVERPELIPAGWEGYHPDQLENLTPRGEQELRDLGARVAGAWPSVFAGGWNRQAFSLESSWKNRSASSATEFAKGAFGHEVAAPLRQEFSEQRKDKLMRPFAACDAHLNLTSGKQGKTQAKLWRAGARMDKLLQHMRAASRFDWLSIKHVLILYKTCGYLMLSEPELVRGSSVVPALCQLFEGKDVEALEYYFDLKKWREFGYGHSVNHKLARPLLEKILTEWTSANHLGSFRFGHAETTLPFLVALGLYQDPFALRASSTDEQIASRLWNTSSIAPMGSNLVLVLYQCRAHTRKVQLFHDEQLIRAIPAVCPEPHPDGLCNAESFKTSFGNFDETAWNQVCHV